MQRHQRRFSSKLATTAACVVALWAAPVMAQQNVFSRSDSGTNLWENNTNLPWYYQTSNNNQNRPDNGGRNDVFFGHNNNLAQDINTHTWYQLRTLTLQSTATSNRTFTPSGTAGISLTVGYTGESGTGAHTFNNQFGIDGSSVTFTNNGGLFTGTGTIFLNTNGLTFAGGGNFSVATMTVSGAGASVTKTGAGILTTNNRGTFTGGNLYINQGRWIASAQVAMTDLDTASAINLGGGTLEVRTTSAINKTYSSAPITVSSPSTLAYNSTDTGTSRTFTLSTASLTLNANLTAENISTSSSLASAYNISRVITGSGDLIVSTTTDVTETTFTPRRVQLSADSPSWAGNLVIARGTASVNPSTTTSKVAGTGDIIIGSTGDAQGAALSFNHAIAHQLTNNIQVRSGGFRMIRNSGDFNANPTLSGAITLDTDLTVVHAMNADRSITLSGNIGGVGGLNITRGGGVAGSRVRLTSPTANTFGGITKIYGNGALQIGLDGHLGTPPGSPTPGRLVLDSGTLYSTADFTLNANRGIALGPNAGASAGTFDVAATRTLTYNGIIANNGSGTGQLIKAGSGTLSLGGANTYSGSTTVSGGVLLLENISGSATGSGSITVSAGATLGGNGRATGSAAIDGFLAPGASVGDIELGSLSMGSGSQFTLELDTVADTADAVITQGSVSITSGAKLQLSFVAVNPGAYANTFVIVNNRSAAATTGMFDTMPAAGGLLQYTVNYGVNWDGDGQDNDITITFTSVPEPAMTSLLAATSLALRRRRR